MRRLLLVVAMLSILRCASVQPQNPKYVVGSFPDIGVRTTVTVGQVMVTKYDYLSLATATLREPVGGSAWKGRNALTAGSVLVPAVSSGQTVYCQPPSRLGAPCLKDTNNDGRFDYASTMNAYGMLVNGGEIPPASYRVADQSIKDGFKYELLYEGIDKGVARIAYREFTESLARPAFSQDLTYTLDPGGHAQIRFKSVAATIYRADNNEIEYTVEKQFESPSGTQ